MDRKCKNLHFNIFHLIGINNYTPQSRKRLNDVIIQGREVSVNQDWPRQLKCKYKFAIFTRKVKKNLLVDRILYL